MRAGIMNETTRLDGLRVLVAESVALLAWTLAEEVRVLGGSVLGPARSVAEAMRLLRRERPDLALLEAALADGPATPVAVALQALRVPFALVTAHEQGSLAEPVLRAAPYLGKPYLATEVEGLLLGLRQAKARPGPDPA
jgi:AmiR/NasT family two-component response regulator